MNCDSRLGQDTANKALLANHEWVSLVKMSCDAFQATSNENLRYRALKQLKQFIPYHSAAYYLIKPETKTLDSCFVAQRIGEDIPVAELERYLYATGEFNQPSIRVWQGRNDRATVGASAFAVGTHTLDGFFILACTLAYHESLLGVITLQNTPDQGEFSQRDHQILEVLSLSQSQRLHDFSTSGDYGVLRSSDLHEEFGLTKREVEVLNCVAYGMTTAEIAAKLAITANTARKHLEHIHRKTGVNNRMSLIKFAQPYLSTP